MLGPDHAASLEFTTFKAMVENCRKAFLSLGSDQKSFLKSERTLHNILIRKFVARNNIKKGEKLNRSNIKTALIYSKKGILPKFYYQILNRKTKKAIDKGKTIFLKDLVK